jgi:hypothetical protein
MGTTRPVPCPSAAVKVCLDPNTLAIALVLFAAAGYALFRYGLPGLGFGALFVLNVKNGRVTAARGKPPVRLVQDIQDVVGKPPVKRATIYVHADGPRARLTVRGTVDEGRVQRLRNVLGLYPLAKLR